jgi:hypothetical protein
VHPRHETSTHYFSCSGGTGTDSTKRSRDTLRRTCVFASGGIYGSRSAFRCDWGMKRRCTTFHARVGPVRIQQKARWEMLRQTFVFASGASGAQNIDALFFILGLDRYGFNKKHARTRYAELVFSHPTGFAFNVVHSGASGDMLRRTCVLASGGICVSRSACRCVRGVKHRCTIFHARVGPVQIP